MQPKEDEPIEIPIQNEDDFESYFGGAVKGNDALTHRARPNLARIDYVKASIRAWERIAGESSSYNS